LPNHPIAKRREYIPEYDNPDRFPRTFSAYLETGRGKHHDNVIARRRPFPTAALKGKMLASSDLNWLFPILADRKFWLAKFFLPEKGNFGWGVGRKCREVGEKKGAQLSR
jgi:hypothetical protein